MFCILGGGNQSSARFRSERRKKTVFRFHDTVQAVTCRRQKNETTTQNLVSPNQTKRRRNKTLNTSISIHPPKSMHIAECIKFQLQNT